MKEQNPYVVSFFSCVAVLSEGKHKKENWRWNNDSNNSDDETVSD